jgi:hypothetical protein
VHSKATGLISKAAAVHSKATMVDFEISRGAFESNRLDFVINRAAFRSNHGWRAAARQQIAIAACVLCVLSIS